MGGSLKTFKNSKTLRFISRNSLLVFLLAVLSSSVFILCASKSSFMVLGIMIGISFLVLSFAYPKVIYFLILFLVFSGFTEFSFISSFRPLLVLSFYMGMFIFYDVLKHNKKIQINSVHLAGALLWGTVIFSFFFAKNIDLCIWRSYWFFRSYILFLIPQLLFDNIEDVKLSFKVIILAMIANVIYVLKFLLTSQLGLSYIELGGLWRAGGAYFDPNIWATMLLLTLFVALYFAESGRKRIVKILYYGFTVLILFGIFVSFSRMGFLTLGVITALYVFQKYGMKGVILSIFLLSFLVIIVYTLPYFARYRTLINIFLKGGVIDLSIRERLNLMKLSFALFKTSPLTGIGIGNFLEYSSIVASQTKVVHSMYLEVLCENGILGFLCLSYILVSYPVRFIFLRNKNEFYKYLNLSVLAVLIMGLALSIEYHVFLWVLLGLLETALKLSGDLSDRNTLQRVSD